MFGHSMLLGSNGTFKMNINSHLRLDSNLSSRNLKRKKKGRRNIKGKELLPLMDPRNRIRPIRKTTALGPTPLLRARLTSLPHGPACQPLCRARLLAGLWPPHVRAFPLPSPLNSGMLR